MQVLTNDRVWNDVIQAGSARHFQERVLSAIVAGYPKPRVVAHLTSRVVSEVFAAALLATEGLRNLTRRASTPLPTGIGGAFANPALSDYGGTSTVGAEFLRAEHDDLVTGDPRTPVASRRLRSASVSRLLEGIDDARDLTTGLGQVTSIAEELNRDWLELLPGRGVDDDDWKAEVQARVDRLDEHFESARRNATDKVHQWMNQEVAEFESWLIGQLNLAFDAPAQPNDVVARWLGGLESQRSYLRQWFAASQEEELSWQVTGIADVPFDGDGAYEFGSDSRDAGAQSDMSLESRLPLGSYRYQPPKAGAFAVATRAVQDELERRPRPPKSGKLLAVLLGIVVGLGVGLGVAWFANGRSLPSSVEWPWLLVVISAAAIGGAVAYIVWSRFARSADEHARHLRYLDGLLEQLARERFLAVAWGAVRQEYAVTFANRVESVIRSAAEDVTALREVFLHIAKEADLAAASVTRAAHETAAVEPPPGVVPASAVGLLLSRIAIHSEGGSWEVVLERDGQQPPLRLPLADALEVLNAATQPEGESLRPQTTAERRYLEFVDGINDEALTCLTGGDEAFPQTLAEAVEQWPDVPLAELRRTLTDRTDRRTDPSSPANQGESAAPPAIVAYGGNSPGLPELARTVAEGLGLPGVSARQVADIGESVAVIRTFEPEGGVPGDLMELRASEQGVRATADRAYYYDYPFGDPETLGKEGEIRRRWSQLESDFHVLPELAAAAAIEAKLDRKRPLSNAIVRRLFGSDIGNDVHHPTLLGLFYFLRAAGSLTERKGETRSGALAREFVLNHAGGELLLLKTDENPSTDAPFGGGQPWVDCLERLELLMTLTGGSTSAMDAALPLAHSEQDSAETWRAWDQLQVNDLRALQTSIVRAWNATREAHSKRMQEVAREDGAAMQGSTAGGDWTNVVGAVLNYHEAHR